METTSAQTVIAADVEIVGTVKSKGTVRVDGKLDGELHCDKDAVVGKTASVKGNIHATSVVVEGTVTGNLVARERVELKATARLTGDLKAKRLVVEDGVVFVGRSEVNPAGESAGAPSTPTTAATPGGTVSPPASEPPRAGIFGKR
jgi:cytoskeletal protein CcmA (bactofilin family)